MQTAISYIEKGKHLSVLIVVRNTNMRFRISDRRIGRRV